MTRIAMFSTAGLDLAGTLMSLWSPSESYGLYGGATLVVLTALPILATVAFAIARRIPLANDASI